MDNSSDLRIGIIGLGLRWRIALHAHKPGQGSRLVAGADVIPGAVTKFTQEFEGTQGFDNYKKMLDEVKLDAVFVTSPDYLHEEHAIAALSRGIAVYLEKPMAITVESCDRILAAAQASGARLYVGHNMRHMPFVQEMKRIVDSGEIGEVKAAWCRHFIAYGGDAYFKDWHSERRYVNSLLLQKAVHDIDVLHWICGGYTQKVVGMGDMTLYDRAQHRRSPDERGNAGWSDNNWPPLSNTGFSPIIDVEDVSHIMMRLDNGVHVTYQQCHYTPDSWRNYTIIGTEGRIENIGDEPGHCEIRIWNKRTGFKERGDRQVVIHPVEGGHGGADPLIIKEFLDYVREGIPTITDPIAARAAVAAGALAAESLRSGSLPKRVPPLNLPAATRPTAGAQA